MRFFICPGVRFVSCLRGIIMLEGSSILCSQHFYMGFRFYNVCEADAQKAPFNVHLLDSHMDAVEFRPFGFY